MDTAEIVITTLLPPTGETGVHTHFNEFCRYLRGEHRPAKLISAYGVNRWRRRMHFPLPTPLINKVDRSSAIWWNIKALTAMVILQLRSVLADPSVRAVYAQDVFSAAAALRARKSSRQRVILAVHFNRDIADELSLQLGIRRDGWLCRWLEQAQIEVLQQVDGVVYMSTFVRNAIQAEGIRTSSIVLPNFITPTEASDTSFSNDLINIGSMEPRKNQQYLLRVLAEARACGRRYTLTLVGKGADEPMLRALAYTLGIGDQVTFAGLQPSAARFVPAHRFYVHSAILENLPIALLEALAAGRPILAACVGGVGEVFSDGIEGYYWDLADPKSGARKLICAMETPALYRKLARAARQRFRNSFTTAAVAPKLESFVLSGRTGESILDASPNVAAN